MLGSIRPAFLAPTRITAGGLRFDLNTHEHFCIMSMDERGVRTTNETTNKGTFFLFDVYESTTVGVAVVAATLGGGAARPLTVVTDDSSGVKHIFDAPESHPTTTVSSPDVDFRAETGKTPFRFVLILLHHKDH